MTDRPEPQKPIWRAQLRDMWPRDPEVNRSYLNLVAISFILQILTFAAPLQIQLVIDKAISNADGRLLIVLAVAFFILALCQTTLDYVRSRLQFILRQHTATAALQRTTWHLLRVPIRYFESRNVGDIISRLNSSKTAQDSATAIALTFAMDGIMAVIALTIMFSYSIALTVVVIISITLNTAIQWLTFPLQRQASKLEIELRADEQTGLMETIRNAQSVRVYGQEFSRFIS